MNYHDNTAYDFDLFAPKKVVELPESPRSHAKRTKAKAKSRAKGSVLNRTWVTVAAVAVAVVLILAQLQCQLQTSEVVDQIHQTKNEIETLQSENTRLQVELNGKVSFSNMEEMAKELGMQKITVAQTKYINLHTQDQGEVVGEGQGLFTALAEWF